MMTDDALLQILQETVHCCQEGRQSCIRNGLEYLDRSTRGRMTDHTQRERVYQILNGLSRGSMRKLDETIDALSSYLQQESRTSLRNVEKTIRYAENYGADSATIQRLKQDEISAMMAMTTAGPFANIAAQACKKLASLLNETIPVNQQTIDLAQANLDKAIADKAKAEAAAAKADNLAYLAKLATATTAARVSL